MNFAGALRPGRQLSQGRFGRFPGRSRHVGQGLLAKGCSTAGAIAFMFPTRNNMANRFGTDILIEAPDPMRAAHFYEKHLGFEITDHNPRMIGLHGKHINLFIEPGRRSSSLGSDG